MPAKVSPFEDKKDPLSLITPEPKYVSGGPIVVLKVGQLMKLHQIAQIRWQNTRYGGNPNPTYSPSPTEGYQELADPFKSVLSRPGSTWRVKSVEEGVYRVEPDRQPHNNMGLDLTLKEIHLYFDII